MRPKYANAVRDAREILLWDRNGLIGRFVRWGGAEGGWLPVVLRFDLWKFSL
jgi:hypothetical protein